MPLTPPPRWMSIVLWLAAVYNLVWGLAVVLFPSVPFTWAGMPAPIYPSIVQCLAMVIGVYGIGYGIAARDPVTHWPIVLVGLLGKVFGPIGFLWTASQGELPWSAGVIILANDLIWWLPFTAMLLYAVREHDSRRLGALIGPIDSELQRASTSQGETLWNLSQRQPVLVVFVRHSGCSFCREAIADLKLQRDRLQAAGVQPVVVHMGTTDDGRQMLASAGLTDVPQISDPQRRLYHAFELPLGTLTQLSGPQVIWRAVMDGTLLRYGVGRMVGNGMQLGGAFLLEHGRVTRAFRARSTADRTSFVDLACPVTPQPA